MTDIFLSLKIRAKDRVLFDGDVRSVSSINEKGPFDIIPYHTHFISILRENITIVNQDSKASQIPVQRGIIWVKDNKVEIYVGL